VELRGQSILRLRSGRTHCTASLRRFPDRRVQKIKAARNFRAAGRTRRTPLHGSY